MRNALELIESVNQDRVLFAGESIRDIYEYVSPLGRPLKDLILSVQSKRREVFRGGIEATANHARDFCPSVEIWSDRTVTKLRYVEEKYSKKLFQVYLGTETNSDPKPDVTSFDTVCVVDYGHGMMQQQYAVDMECDAPYLAINVQTNSGNYGFNLATKYDKCDYLVVDELEARLATQNQNGPIQESIQHLSAIAPKVIVTLGKDGAIGYSQKDGFVSSPALSRSIVDTMGAGDAFFGVTAPMSKYGRIADLLLIGNAAGALKAETLGHKKSVTKKDLIQRIQTL
jgi:bifunctional ADP-heptose synthase (sugar kinase/adenylyltransferase)